MKTLFLAAALCLTTGIAATAAPTDKPAPKDKKVELVCPVTGEKITSMNAAGGKSVYKGKTYYFCCASCKPEFDKNPAKFAKAAAKPAAAAAKKS